MILFRRWVTPTIVLGLLMLPHSTMVALSRISKASFADSKLKHAYPFRLNSSIRSSVFPQQ